MYEHAKCILTPEDKIFSFHQSLKDLGDPKKVVIILGDVLEPAELRERGEKGKGEGGEGSERRPARRLKVKFLFAHTSAPSTSSAVRDL